MPCPYERATIYETKPEAASKADRLTIMQASGGGWTGGPDSWVVPESHPALEIWQQGARANHPLRGPDVPTLTLEMMEPTLALSMPRTLQASAPSGGRSGPSRPSESCSSRACLDAGRVRVSRPPVGVGGPDVEQALRERLDMWTPPGPKLWSVGSQTYGVSPALRLSMTH